MSFVDKLKAKYSEVAEIFVNPGMVPIEVAQKRLAICEACPNLIKATYQCSECGCFMKLKTKLVIAKCPLPEPKWDRYEN